MKLKMTLHFRLEMMQARREQCNIFKALKVNTCIPVADSFWYMANQYNIVKLKNKRKLKKKESKQLLAYNSIAGSNTLQKCKESEKLF